MPEAPSVWLADTAERAISTFIQSLIMYIAVSADDNGLTWKPLVAALIPPVLTVILAAIPNLTPKIKNHWADVGFRVMRTALTTILGAVVATGFNLFSASDWTAAFFVAGSAIMVTVKSEFARYLAAKRAADTTTPTQSLSSTSLAWKNAA